jgi:hypothetical protein
VLGVSLTVEDFTMAEATGQRRWHARQGHGARMAMWSALGTGGGVVGTARARRGEAVSAARRSFRTWPVGIAFNPPGAFGYRRPWQPIRVRREATLPLTAGPDSSSFPVLKITPEQK